MVLLRWASGGSSILGLGDSIPPQALGKFHDNNIILSDKEELKKGWSALLKIVEHSGVQYRKL